MAAKSTPALNGTSRAPQASFVGKVESVQTGPPKFEGLRRNVGRLLR